LAKPQFPVVIVRYREVKHINRSMRNLRRTNSTGESDWWSWAASRWKITSFATRILVWILQIDLALYVFRPLAVSRNR
jgi:hypothetical protein